jgi:hypothetical protein
LINADEPRLSLPRDRYVTCAEVRCPGFLDTQENLGYLPECRYSREGQEPVGLTGVDVGWGFGMINGYKTAADTARELGITTKTLNNWIRRWMADGLISKPPTFRYGLRAVRHFPSDYLKKIEQLREAHEPSA